MSIAVDGVHVINGLSAAGSWKQAHHAADRLIVNQDIFSCGPTQSCTDLRVWEDIRVEFLRKLYPEWQEMDFYGLESDLLRNIERLNQESKVYVWLSTGLEDQLLLLFLVHVAGIVGADPERFFIVQYESPATRKFPIRLMGELNPQQMQDHPPPTRLMPEGIDYCRMAWHAITGRTPEALSALASEETAPLPFVLSALRNMCRRYPDLATGLTYWDRQLLPNISERGPSAARIIGYTMCADLADTDCVGDLYLFFRLRSLGSSDLPAPLVTLGGTNLRMGDTTASLTETGAQVCAGRLSSYPTNPIDEWIGGCHLSTTENNLWFYESGRLVSAA